MIKWIKKIRNYLRVKNLLSVKIAILLVVFSTSTLVLNTIYDRSVNQIEAQQKEIIRLNSEMSEIKSRSILFLTKEQTILYNDTNGDGGLYNNKRLLVSNYRYVVSKYRKSLLKDFEISKGLDRSILKNINYLLKRKEIHLTNIIHLKEYDGYTNQYIIGSPYVNITIVENIDLLLNQIESNINKQVVIIEEEIQTQNIYFKTYLIAYFMIVLLLLFYIFLDFRIIKKREEMKDSFIDTIIKAKK